MIKIDYYLLLWILGVCALWSSPAILIGSGIILIRSLAALYRKAEEGSNRKRATIGVVVACVGLIVLACFLWADLGAVSVGSALMAPANARVYTPG